MSNDASEMNDGELRRILDETDTIVMIGASPKSNRDSHRVMRYLQQKGYRVIPVNPTLEPDQTILGEKVFASIEDVNEPFQMVDVFRKSDAVAGIVDQILALDTRPKFLWLQLGVVDSIAADRATDAGIDVVMDRCIKIEHGRLNTGAGDISGSWKVGG